MNKEEIINKLNEFNTSKFKFEPIEHKYTYGDDIEFISVTTVTELFKQPFDREGVSKYVSERDGIEQEAVLEMWDAKNERSKVMGTYIHEYIENYYNGIYQPLPTDLEYIDRINKFNVIHSKKLHKLEPLMFEARIFDTEDLIAGTIDALFLYKGKIVIVDWKTNTKIATDEERRGRYNNLIHEKFRDVYQNEHNLYSIQLSIYRRILEKKGLEVSACYIVYLPPTEEGEGRIIKGKDYRDRLDVIFGDKTSFDLKNQMESLHS